MYQNQFKRHLAVFFIDCIARANAWILKNSKLRIRKTMQAAATEICVSLFARFLHTQTYSMLNPKQINP